MSLQGFRGFDHAVRCTYISIIMWLLERQCRPYLSVGESDHEWSAVSCVGLSLEQSVVDPDHAISCWTHIVI